MTMIIGETPLPSGPLGVDAIAVTMKFGDFLALEAATGKVLHRVAMRQPAGGGVMTYQAGGSQRIGVAAGLENTIVQTKGNPMVIVFGL